jgi:phage terminase Nu1 subunit (DNA packaging protein)
MKKPLAQKLPWVNRHTAAALFGVSVRQFDDRHRKLAPTTATKAVGRDTYFDFPVLLASFVEAETASHVPSHGAVADPMMAVAGEDTSGGLERYRLARASQEEIKLALMQGEVVRITEIEPGLTSAFKIIRQAGETLIRVFGNEAGVILTEAVDAAANRVNETFDISKSKGAE